MQKNGNNLANYLHYSNNFRTFVVENKNEEVMSEEAIIKYNTPAARDAAIRGMLNAKKEWLSYVQQLPSK